MCTLTTFVDYGILAHYTIMAKPIKSLELHYPMIQFLIINLKQSLALSLHYSNFLINEKNTLFGFCPYKSHPFSVL